MTLGRYDETSIMIAVDEVIATCSFPRQVRNFFTANDVGIELSNRTTGFLPTRSSVSVNLHQ